MRRFVGFFVCLLGLLALGCSPVLAGPGPRSRPIHRHKPTAGNYVHVYRYYRGHSRARNGVLGGLARLFRRRPGASGAPLRAGRGRAHRTL